MPRGYRRYVLAAFGWLILAALPPSQAAESNKAASKQSDRAELARIATAIEKLPKADAPDAGCQPGQDNRSSDLCAQWKAADAALESAIWTKNAFFAGLVGLLIGGFTLYFAGRAAHWAKLAAVETKRSADAADESLAHAKSMAAIQLRPYLFVDQIRYIAADLLDGPISNQAVMTIKNFGSTPAKDIAVQAGCAIADTALHRLGIFPCREQRVPYFLAPGATFDIAVRIEGFRNRMFPSDSHVLACRFSLTYKESSGGDYGLFETWYIPREEMNRSKLFTYYDSP